VTSPVTLRWKQQAVSARPKRVRPLTLAAKAARTRKLFIVQREYRERATGIGIERPLQRPLTVY
jgi:hypothetical protein